MFLAIHFEIRELYHYFISFFQQFKTNCSFLLTLYRKQIGNWWNKNMNQLKLINSGLQSTVKIRKIMKATETLWKKTMLRYNPTYSALKQYLSHHFFLISRLDWGKVGIKNFFFLGGENFYFVWKIAI